MTRQHLVAIATLGSASLLAGAFAFQHIGGLAPCSMCIWQRYPHALAAAVGLVAVLIPLVPLLLVGALSALTTAGIGFYHVGVERKWWDGPSTCTSSDISGMSSEDLMAQIMSAPLVRCDDIAWSLAGLSMAGWNMVLSLGLFAVWIAALRQKT